MNPLQNPGIPQAATLPEALLCCPRCRTKMFGNICLRCPFRVETRHGIALAMAPERVEYYAAFTNAYEAIRSAEGRGSSGDEFYLSLPWKDLSGRNRWQWRIRARSYDYLMTHVLPPLATSDCRRVLDVGAGNGWLSYRLALAGYRSIAADLSLSEQDGLRAAEHYRGSLPGLFPRFQAEMDRLPFYDEQFDVVLFNASFHYSEDAEVTLREALRCLRAGGRAIVIDTPWYSREESGRQMVSERRAAFLRRYGTASDAIEHFEYLTDERLQDLAATLSICWEVYSPHYGLRWAMRPLMAKIRRKREPSQFRIYVAQRNP